MKLKSWTFPHAIAVDGSIPIYAVFVGRDAVTDIELEGGVLTVSTASGIWFVLTQFGFGRPATEPPAEVRPPMSHICLICGKTCQNAAGLAAHSRQHGRMQVEE